MIHIKKQQLKYWQDRLNDNKNAYLSQLEPMDEREALYMGTREIAQNPNAISHPTKKASHVRNIAAELIEAQVDSNIPRPKVTAKRKKDEPLARKIEDFLKGEMDRLPFEYLNDMDERTTPIQGGNFFLVEWDSECCTHKTSGGLKVSLVHPKQLIPQNGIYDINNMDYFFIQIPQTKEYIKRHYGVDVETEDEDCPDIRSRKEGAAQDLVTLNTAYYKNKKGGIGRFIWAGNTTLEDREDYQARRVPYCARCHEPMEEQSVCTHCGSKEITYETERGEFIYGAGIQENAGSSMNWRPFYQPCVYPIALRKNVSLYGRLLGDSDLDKIKDQQEAIKKTETRIEEKLATGGSLLGLSDTAKVELTDRQMKVVRFKTPQEEAMTRVFNLQADTAQDLQYAAAAYESARNIIGITDSFQGRRDTTAQSGKAKEFSASQAAGRLESKRVMKDAAYAAVFELMFKFALAYADEPREVVGRGGGGQLEYSTFQKYDFLEKDATGQYYWNDEFYFSVDSAASLMGNRGAMWEETRKNLASGALGDPKDPKTRILFWMQMETYAFPGAAEIRRTIETQEELAQKEAFEADALPKEEPINEM